jgi:hypothetical protein
MVSRSCVKRYCVQPLELAIFVSTTDKMKTRATHDVVPCRSQVGFAALVVYHRLQIIRLEAVRI